MKHLFVALLLLLGFCSFGRTTYYISNSGVTSNNGTSAATPWPYSKASTTTLIGGDSVLFKRGETFYGKLSVNQNGSNGAPIVFGAYGSGAIPIITGFKSISAWTLISTNIYEETTSSSTLSTCNMVSINGVNTPMGRYPNTTYLTYQTHTTTSITSSSMVGSSINWTGAEAGISNTPFTILRVPITAHNTSTGTLTYKNTKTTGDTAYNNINSFFIANYIIQNDPRTLDVNGEWYYNPSTRKLRVYSNTGAAPTGVQLVTVDTLVKCTSRSYITFNNIAFIGSNSFGAMVESSTHIVFLSCTFDYNGKNAIKGTVTNSKVQSCTFNRTNNNGVEFSGGSGTPPSGSTDTIRLSTFRKTGMVIMGMQQGSAQAVAISVRGDNELVEYNNVDSTGFCGIRFLGSGTVIQNNFVGHSCMILYDAGSIYTFNSGSLTRSNIKILNNIVVYTPLKNGGIYMDDRTNGVQIKGNTVTQTAIGIYLHNSWNMQVLNNTVYDNVDNIESNWNDAAVTQNNLTIKNNIFFAKDATSRTGNYYTLNVATMPLPFTADSNYYARPINQNTDSATIQTVLNGNTVTKRTLTQWRSLNNQEAHSKKSPVGVSTTSNLRLEYNSTSTNKTVSLGANYIDVKSTSYPGTITLAPYTSAVLIYSSALSNQAPVAHAGADQTITLPTSSVTLVGSATDDGTIASHTWTKVSGTGGTITSPTANTTTVTGLTAGTYIFRYSATDNLGAIGTDDIQVTVVSANIHPTSNAGPDQTITLPTSAVSLSGTGSDPDGTIVGYRWTKISGPGTTTILNPDNASVVASGLQQGVYDFQLRVTDNSGDFGYDHCIVTVNSSLVSTNQTPVANAGADQTISGSTTTLSGSASDDGTIADFDWVQIAGPTSAVRACEHCASTGVSGLTIPGTYTLVLFVTDDSAAVGSDTMNIVVTPAADTAPVSDAGPDQSIATTIATLDGSASYDPDGTITAYKWTKISGPIGSRINGTTTAVTTVKRLVNGTYVFRLRVTDNLGATSDDTVTIVVTLGTAFFQAKNTIYFIKNP